MLLLGSSFAKFPIMSLRTGTTVGSVVGHVINPHKLSVDALWCRVYSQKDPLLLFRQDIRDLSPKAIIIDDVDVLCDRGDAIRLESIIALKFELLGKKVISGRLPLGKVADYALDRDGLLVQKLYVEPSIIGRIKSAHITIDRSLIIEVSPQYVKVKGSEVRAQQKTSSLRRAQLSPATSPSAATIEE